MRYETVILGSWDKVQSPMDMVSVLRNLRVYYRWQIIEIEVAARKERAAFLNSSITLGYLERSNNIPMVVP